jgi:murein DD-endopeptidase MepM/ murein hydrolase activator NlpD
MPSLTQRAGAFVVASALILVAMTAQQAEAAFLAESLPPESAEPDFVLAAFPNQSDDVEFFDSWGARRPGGRRHQGIDIHSPKGTPVVAVADGFVIAMKWHRDSGFYIKIAHADGWVSAYVHLNNDTPGTDDGNGGESAAFAPGVGIGSFVRAGDLIGYVGDSGNAEGTIPHTHFALERDGSKINPYPLLVEAIAADLDVSARTAIGPAPRFIQ